MSAVVLDIGFSNLIKKYVGNKTYKKYSETNAKKYDDMNIKLKVYAKLALCIMHNELSEAFPKFYNIMEVMKSDYGFTEEESYNYFKDINNPVDINIKSDYFNIMKDNIQNMLDNREDLEEFCIDKSVWGVMPNYIKMSDHFYKCLKDKENSKENEEVVESEEKEEKRVGRPYIKEERKRNKKVTIYFTQKEFDYLNKLADDSISLYIRNKVLNQYYKEL